MNKNLLINLRKILSISLITGAVFAFALVAHNDEVARIEEREAIVASIPGNRPTAGIIADLQQTVSDAETLAGEKVDEEAIENFVAVVAAAERKANPQIIPVSYKRYATDILNVREQPNTDSEVLGKLVVADKVKVIGEVEDSDFVQIKYKGDTAFVHSDYLSKERPEISVPEQPIIITWSGEVLNAHNGTVQGPSGKETYYNMNMSGVVRIMRNMGNNDEYWVRSDGCKCLGPYIMVAANLQVHPRGSIVETSRGLAVVADTGTFAYSNPTQIDVAVTW